MYCLVDEQPSKTDYDNKICNWLAGSLAFCRTAFLLTSTESSVIWAHPGGPFSLAEKGGSDTELHLKMVKEYYT